MNTRWILLCMLSPGLLAACGPSPARLTEQALMNEALATVRAEFAQTSPPEITKTVWPTITREPYQWPSRLPTIAQPEVEPELESHLVLHDMDGIQGHRLRQISGWRYGFGTGWSWCRSVKWLGGDHLLLYPAIGQVGWSYEMYSRTQPVVINLLDGSLWFPQTNEEPYWGKCDTVYWSSDLGLLISARSGEGGLPSTSFTYTADGEETNRFTGWLAGVSPSRNKIVLANSGLTVVDLAGGSRYSPKWKLDSPHEQVDFKLYWSPDETRIYKCCFHFADLHTRTSFDFTMSELQGIGDRLSDRALHTFGEWVRNGEYFLVEWSIVDDGYPDFYPMFDPVTMTYYEVSEVAGIPAEWTCASTSVSPNRRHVWIVCWEGSYLVDLVTFDSAAYPAGADYYPDWSADGMFAWLKFDDDNLPKILSVSAQDLTPFPIASREDSSAAWHPSHAELAYVSASGRSLILLDAETMSAREQPLVSVFHDVFWDLQGEQIALLAQDGSLFLAQYPALGNLERLTPPMPDVRDVAWSPDGTRLAFVSGADIYIVDTNADP